MYLVDEETGEVSVRDGPIDADDLRRLGAISYDRIALMLLGMALEGEAKAILVSRDPSLIDREEGRIAPLLSSHDLTTLIGRCGIVLTDAERVTLDTATEFVKWAGRYPIPRSAVHGRQKLPEGGWELHRLGSISEHWKILSALVEAIGDLADRERDV